MNKRHVTALAIAGTLCIMVLTVPVNAKDNQAADKSSEMKDQAQPNSAIADGWLDGKLETTLLLNRHLNSFTIDTKVKGGVAYLTGAVESDIDRDLAGEIAQSIKGISKVENNLVVDSRKAAQAMLSERAHERRSFKQSVSDATLTARVKSELLVNGNTAGLMINVDSHSGNVTLTGTVDSAEEKELAGMIADNANGEGSVNNRLKIADQS